MLLAVPYGPEIPVASVSSNMIALAGAGVPPSQLPAVDHLKSAALPDQVTPAAEATLAAARLARSAIKVRGGVSFVFMNWLSNRTVCVVGYGMSSLEDGGRVRQRPPERHLTFVRPTLRRWSTGLRPGAFVPCRYSRRARGRRSAHWDRFDPDNLGRHGNDSSDGE